MRYVLDSSICIAILRDTAVMSVRRFERAVARHHSILLSSLVLTELWYGVHRSLRPVENAATLKKFLLGPVGLLPFDEQAARIAGEVRAELHRTGKTIGSYDTLIAAQCLCHDVTVVTANVKEFSSVRGLKWEDWTR
jgi:tRNA(fMet)-specific endonuclease VapC